MSVQAETPAPNTELTKPPEFKLSRWSGASGTIKRLAKYTAFKLVMTLLTVTIGIYLTIMIANMGGVVDTMAKSLIRESFFLGIANDPLYQRLSPEEQKIYMNSEIALAEKRVGLDRPFAERAAGFLWGAMRMDLGRSINMTSDAGSKEVRLIILERLPTTLILFGTANLLLFFSSIFLALVLSRAYGTFWDKLVIGLSPTSSAPSWFLGLFLILIFSAFFKTLPFGGMVDTPPPDTTIGYALSLGKHLILPVSAIVLSGIFINIYSWRTFFLIFSTEDYVELAKAKGLSPREIERRYILRPSLPTIITSFGLLVINLWTGSILLEGVFQWPGLGRSYFQAIGFYDTPVIVGLTIVYAYLLAITVFVLDFVYALVDPRVKVGS